MLLGVRLWPFGGDRAWGLIVLLREGIAVSESSDRTRFMGSFAEAGIGGIGVSCSLWWFSMALAPFDAGGVVGELDLKLVRTDETGVWNRGS